MASVTASIKLANDMVPTITSSGVANIMHFKNCQVPFPHSVFKMDYKEKVGCDNMDWIYLAQHRGQWQAHLNTVWNLGVPWMVENFFTSWLLASRKGFCSVELIMLVLYLHSLLILLYIP
jgi:hypothetical protein